MKALILLLQDWPVRTGFIELGGRAAVICESQSNSAARADRTRFSDAGFMSEYAVYYFGLLVFHKNWIPIHSELSI